VHPGAGDGAIATVADFARSRTTDTDTERPGIVHRLDRDTSGLLIIAKHAAAKAYLQAQFKTHKVHKLYTLLVVGRLEPETAVIDLPVGRHPSKPLQQSVTPGGRPSQTAYRATHAYNGYTLVEARPQTGRTHQLRVHFAALGHPVAGDITYGLPKRQLRLNRQFLHAAGLELTLPSGKPLRLTSPLPADLQQVIDQLSQESST
jgi:23S rRNA pseudouridine1911/1915/1917 synthase